MHGARRCMAVALSALCLSGCANSPDRGAPRTPRRLHALKVATVEGPVALVSRAGTEALYVAQRSGKVLRLSPRPDGSFVVHPDPVIDVHTNDAADEQGLLGLTFSPDGSRLFISFSDPTDSYNSVLASFPMHGNRVDPGERTDLIRVPQPFHDHQGGSVAFGPDGYLYWGLGDGGHDPNSDLGEFANNNGQNLQAMQGKMLRIDPLHPSSGRPYSIPKDNPFAAGGALPEIWAYGLRNPWRFSFDARTGDLWIGDVGWETREEIDRLPRSNGGGRGANLGWRIKEGTLPAGIDTQPYDAAHPAPPGLTDPIYEYPHPTGTANSRAVIGGFVYRGSRITELQGQYLYSDYAIGGLRALTPSANGTVTSREVSIDGTPIDHPTGFGEDRHHELYALMISGGILRISAD